jgi:hypothetical protein
MAKLASIALFCTLCISVTGTPISAQTPAASDQAAPAGQAPDEATKKISDLVNAEKYVEAQKLTEGLLIAYPNDQQLLKAKTLIEQMLAPTPSTPAANNQPATPATQLTGMDKVEYNALIVLARQAQQTTDLDEQKKLLQQFMGQSSPFLQKHPDLTLLWKFRVLSALSLNEPRMGYEAGQKLLAEGAADSNDPTLQDLLAQLRNKDWLDKQSMENAQEYHQLLSLDPSLTYGPWSIDRGFMKAEMKTTLTLTITGFGDMKEPVNIRMENASPKTCRLDGGETGLITITPRDIAGGTYTTRRNAILTSRNSYLIPCRVNVSVVDKSGKTIKTVTINNGY